MISRVVLFLESGKGLQMDLPSSYARCSNPTNMSSNLSFVAGSINVIDLPKTPHGGASWTRYTHLFSKMYQVNFISLFLFLL